MQKSTHLYLPISGKVTNLGNKRELKKVPRQKFFLIETWDQWERNARYNRQNIVLQRCLNPNPRNLWMCYVSWKNGSKVPSGIKLLIRWPWDEKIILDYLDRPNVITRVLKVEKRTKGGCQRMQCEDSNTCCWFWRWKEEAKHQGVQAASRSWKKQGVMFSHKPGDPCWHLDVSPVRSVSVFK